MNFSIPAEYSEDVLLFIEVKPFNTFGIGCPAFALQSYGLASRCPAYALSSFGVASRCQQTPNSET